MQHAKKIRWTYRHPEGAPATPIMIDTETGSEVFPINVSMKDFVRTEEGPVLAPRSVVDKLIKRNALVRTYEIWKFWDLERGGYTCAVFHYALVPTLTWEEAVDALAVAPRIEE